MKRSVVYAIWFLSGAVLFGLLGIFFGHSIATSGEPVVVVRNLSKVSIPMIRIESDVGESYELGRLAPDASRRMKISGREKAAWVTLLTETGEMKESQKVYVTSQGVLYVVITDTGITVDYQL